MNWLNLTLSLPAEAATVRMRVWRSLKAAGAAVLRDGVYLLPVTAKHRAVFNDVAAEVCRHDGSAYVFDVADNDETGLPGLFDRAALYADFMVALKQATAALRKLGEAESVRLLRKQRKALDQLTAIDFFPGAARTRAEAALQQLEAAQARRFSPDEPQPAQAAIARREAGKFQRKTWATRRRPKIDRLASAWLILRHIDAQARFKWLAKPADCPARAIGFDFDGAEFTHVGTCVTFETLLASFGLDAAPLRRLAAVVHALDVGGERPPEADGLERILDGYRATISADDALLQAVLPVFDSMAAAFAAGADQ